MGRPSLPPGIYFRLLFIGYFEGIDSERGIARIAGVARFSRRRVGRGAARSLDDLVHAPRAPERTEAIAPPRKRIQSGTLHAEALWDRHAARPPGPGILTN